MAFGQLFRILSASTLKTVNLRRGYKCFFHNGDFVIGETVELIDEGVYLVVGEKKSQFTNQ